MASSLFSGAVAGRVVNVFADLELNTGWEPPPGRAVRLFRTTRPGPSFGDGETPVVELEPADAEGFSIEDFADLRRIAAVAADPDAGPIDVGIHYERSEHLFRYNRVEGAFLGAGVRVQPTDPLREAWSVYATGGRGVCGRNRSRRAARSLARGGSTSLCAGGPLGTGGWGVSAAAGPALL